METSPTTLHFPAPGRILLVTNLLDLNAVFPFALHYAQRTHAEVKLLHVLSGREERLGPHLLGGRSRRDTRRPYAETILSDAALQAQRTGVDCTWELHVGDLSRVLTEIEDAWAPDRIIVFRRKIHGDWEPLDPITELILKEASVPILVLGPGCDPAEFLSKERKVRILFATSLDRESRDVAARVLSFAQSHQAELNMLYVIDCQSASDAWFTRVRQYAEQRFQEIVGSLNAQGVRYMIERGQVAETILRMAEEGEYDFILLGSVLGTSFRTDIRPGSAYKIVCEACSPVLVLKRSFQCLPSGMRDVEMESVLTTF